MAESSRRRLPTTYWMIWPQSWRKAFWIGDIKSIYETDLTRDDLLIDRTPQDIEADLQHLRSEIRSLRESIMQMFIGMLVAIAFLTTVIVDHRRAGPSWLHWTLAVAALLLSAYAGTLFGVLLIDNKFIGPAVPPISRADLLGMEDFTAHRLRVGFSRMVRVAWFALLFWMLLAISAALGGPLQSGT